MKVSAADLADRCSILNLKRKRLAHNPDVAQEFFEYLTACSESGVTIEDLHEIEKVNGRIWDLEADIRQGREGLLGLEEVGRRALKIRDLNRERIAIKNRIAAERGEFQEVKGNHASGVDRAPEVAQA